MNLNSIRRVAPVWGAAVLALAMAACVDKDYDLDNVDMTVGLGNTIQLPSNNYTDDIPLDDLLDLGINNFLSVGEDGMYNISAIDDNEFIAHMGVPQFSVPSKTYKGKYVIDLGDFCYKGGGFPTIQHLKGLLHGQTILIRGNHDPDTRKSQNLQKLQQLFDSVYEQLEIMVDGQRIIMNHYPLLTWPHAFGQHPAWQLFGHVHLRKGITGSDAFTVEQCCRPTQYEVGVDLNGFRPISFHRLKERIAFQVQHQCNVIYWLGKT